MASFLAVMIEGKQKWDIMTLDVPNSFVQTPIPKQKNKNIIKIGGSISRYPTWALPRSVHWLCDNISQRSKSALRSNANGII